MRGGADGERKEWGGDRGRQGERVRESERGKEEQREKGGRE